MEKQLVDLAAWLWKHRHQVKHAQITLVDGRKFTIERKAGRWAWQVMG